MHFFMNAPANFAVFDLKLPLGDQVPERLPRWDLGSMVCGLQTTDQLLGGLQATNQLVGGLQTAHQLVGGLQTTNQLVGGLQTANQLVGVLQTTNHGAQIPPW